MLSTSVCVATKLRADPEAGPTLSKPKAIVVDFSSKQSELAVLTTINWACIGRTLSSEMAGTIAMESNFPRTGSGVTEPYESKLVQEAESLIVSFAGKLSRFKRSRVVLSRTFTLAPESIIIGVSVSLISTITVLCWSLHFGRFNVNTYSSSSERLFSSCC